MRHILKPLQRLLLQVILLLACYFASRCFFVLANEKHFGGLSLAGFLRLAFFALRYDLSAIFAINIPYFLLFLLPLPLWKMPHWEKFTQVVFIVINALAFLFEISDWAYYPYNFKRSTADVLNMVSRKGDFWSLLPDFLIDYWYVPLACTAVVLVLIYGNRKICRSTPLQDNGRMTWLTAGLQILRLAVMGGLAVLAIRGGFQYVPIGVRNAVQVTESKYAPIVLNTPFSIITTFTNDKLPDVHYFPDEELSKYIDPVKQYTGKTFMPKNVVLIIIESFSKEFTKLGGHDVSYTPFLDSLMDRSYVCTQAYANGLHSAEGVPAVISGVPSLMDESITTSVYGANRLTALPNILKQEGYSSAFYHGGTNGTMSFDVFCAAAGFDHYYGRTEYNNEKDYDGNWGIWDEPFLQYFEQGINKMKPPFMATVFTLSSHPPFGLPKEYKNVFPQGTLPIHPAIGYTDMAVRKFFAAAEKEPWYNNTLFIITADHCSPLSAYAYNQKNMGQYAIPVFFFAPGDASLRGHTDTLTQQIDIMPSVLDYLGYSKKFFAYGNSIFSPAKHRYVVNSISGFNQWLSDNYLMQATDVEPKGLFAFPADSNCTDNLVNKNIEAKDRQLNYLKAYIQSYRNALNRNQLWVQ
ncbi:LTA synthase family protein [Chitinophagaceae bacterium MMS25-I14]